MDIQAKVDHIASLIEKISEIKEYRKNLTLAAEFRAAAEDSSLPKVFREFCHNAAVSVSGDSTGPLDNTSKKHLKEIFLTLKVAP